MARVKLIDLMNMSDQEKIAWLSQYSDEAQVIIVNQIRDLKHETDCIVHADYDSVNRTVKMAAVLLTEIGL